MKDEIAMTVLPLLFVGAIYYFLPRLTRRGIYFGATVDAGFPQSADGQRLLRSFRLQLAGWLGAAAVLAWLTIREHPLLAVLAPLIILVAGTGTSYWLKFREVHARYGARQPEVRSASLSAEPRSSGLSFWTMVPPFAALGALAVYLRLHWYEIPERFPIHWGTNGVANGWAHRNWAGVYGPVLFGVYLNIFLFGLAWLINRESRQTVMRYVSVRALQFSAYLLTVIMGLMALLPFAHGAMSPLHIPFWMIPAGALISIAGLVYWSYRKMSEPSDKYEGSEPTNDAYWKAGAFYWNPDDPAIFVGKRVGIGLTMNFANKWSWVTLAGIIVAPFLLMFLMGKS